MAELIFFGVSDAFQNPIVVWIALFLLFFLMLNYALSKVFRDNRGVGIAISYVLALLIAYGLLKNGENFFQFSFLDVNFDFFRNFGLYGLTDFLNALGLLGIPIIFLFLGIIYILGKAFWKFFRVNLGM